MTDDLRANNTEKINTMQAYNATNLTVNVGMVVNEALAADVITKRLANEVAVSSDFVVEGALLVDTINASLASQLSIKDNVVVGLTRANENLAF